jgi:hypothetical protein
MILYIPRSAFYDTIQYNTIQYKAETVEAPSTMRCARTFQGLHSVRLWTFTILVLENLQCDSSIFEKNFIWFLGQLEVWLEPNISQIDAWSSSIYAWYQKFEFDFCFNFFVNFKQK